MSKLAIEGGEAVRKRPLPGGKKVGKEELKELVDVIDSGHLYRHGGTKVIQFEKAFAQLHGVSHAVASNSGTSSIHVGIAMVNPSPGDEIITCPVTDLGSILPIVFHNCIPIFADLNPETYNADIESIKANITPKTKAIMPIHLFGNPSDMDPIVDISKRKGIPIIEDCSQAHLALYKGKKVGTLGDIGCFSLQQSKHMTTGAGGVTITDNRDYGERGSFFMDKGQHQDWQWPRKYGDIALNYHMNELSGAVALAQVKKVQDVVNRRRKNGEMLTSLLDGVPNIKPQKVLPDCHGSYWLYGLTVNPDAPFTASQFVKAYTAEGLPASPSYIGKPIFMCSIAISEQKTFGDSSHPWDHPNARKGIKYTEGLCPKTEDMLNRMVTLPMAEWYGEEEVKDMAAALRKVATQYKV
ncbi:DegT/DnrJ/EryC1/StrS family aminotransferase [Candidatus Poribacteria bacterium]|nr:DegT/DnrJ/EryC1/StrS family aminotransferase [Candidatus Poribacteria bacterium]